MRPEVPLQEFEIFADGLDHPEGLAFDVDANLWAGGELGQIYKINRKGKVRTVAMLGGFNLGLTFSRRQHLFVCNPKLGALIQLDRSGQTLPIDVTGIGIERFDLADDSWSGRFRGWLDQARAQPLAAT